MRIYCWSLLALARGNGRGFMPGLAKAVDEVTCTSGLFSFCSGRFFCKFPRLSLSELSDCPFLSCLSIFRSSHLPYHCDSMLFEVLNPCYCHITSL